jgi:hypothetical protein
MSLDAAVTQAAFNVLVTYPFSYPFYRLRDLGAAGISDASIMAASAAPAVSISPADDATSQSNDFSGVLTLTISPNFTLTASAVVNAANIVASFSAPVVTTIPVEVQIPTSSTTDCVLPAIWFESADVSAVASLSYQTAAPLGEHLATSDASTLFSGFAAYPGKCYSDGAVGLTYANELAVELHSVPTISAVTTLTFYDLKLGVGSSLEATREHLIRVTINIGGVDYYCQSETFFPASTGVNLLTSSTSGCLIPTASATEMTICFFLYAMYDDISDANHRGVVDTFNPVTATLSPFGDYASLQYNALGNAIIHFYLQSTPVLVPGKIATVPQRSLDNIGLPIQGPSLGATGLPSGYRLAFPADGAAGISVDPSANVELSFMLSHHHFSVASTAAKLDTGRVAPTCRKISNYSSDVTINDLKGELYAVSGGVKRNILKKVGNSSPLPPGTSTTPQSIDGAWYAVVCTPTMDPTSPDYVTVKYTYRFMDEASTLYSENDVELDIFAVDPAVSIYVYARADSPTLKFKSVAYDYDGMAFARLPSPFASAGTDNVEFMVLPVFTVPDAGAAVTATVSELSYAYFEQEHDVAYDYYSVSCSCSQITVFSGATDATSPAESAPFDVLVGANSSATPHCLFRVEAASFFLRNRNSSELSDLSVEGYVSGTVGHALANQPVPKGTAVVTAASGRSPVASFVSDLASSSLVPYFSSQNEFVFAVPSTVATATSSSYISLPSGKAYPTAAFPASATPHIALSGATDAIFFQGVKADSTAAATTLAADPASRIAVAVPISSFVLPVDESPLSLPAGLNVLNLGPPTGTAVYVLTGLEGLAFLADAVNNKDSLTLTDPEIFMPFSSSLTVLAHVPASVTGGLLSPWSPVSITATVTEDATTGIVIDYQPFSPVQSDVAAIIAAGTTADVGLPPVAAAGDVAYNGDQVTFTLGSVDYTLAPELSFASLHALSTVFGTPDGLQVDVVSDVAEVAGGRIVACSFNVDTAAGQYCPGCDSSGCSTVSFGFWPTDDAHMTSISCPAGEYLPTGTGVCAACTASHICTGNNFRQTCEHASWYVPNATAVECVLSPRSKLLIALVIAVVLGSAVGFFFLRRLRQKPKHSTAPTLTAEMEELHVVPVEISHEPLASSGTVATAPPDFPAGLAEPAADDRPGPDATEEELAAWRRRTVGSQQATAKRQVRLSDASPAARRAHFAKKLAKAAPAELLYYPFRLVALTGLADAVLQDPTNHRAVTEATTRLDDGDSLPELTSSDGLTWVATVGAFIGAVHRDGLLPVDAVDLARAEFLLQAVLSGDRGFLLAEECAGDRLALEQVFLVSHEAAKEGVTGDAFRDLLAALFATFLGAPAVAPASCTEEQFAAIRPSNPNAFRGEFAELSAKLQL